MNLHQPLHVLPGVGPKSAEKYAKLEMCIRDRSRDNHLFHYRIYSHY